MWVFLCRVVCLAKHFHTEAISEIELDKSLKRLQNNPLNCNAVYTLKKEDLLKVVNKSYAIDAQLFQSALSDKDMQHLYTILVA